MTTTTTTNYGFPIPPLQPTGEADGYDTLMEAADAAIKSAIDAVVAVEADPVVGAITGIVKANGAGTISAASAGDFPTLNQDTTGTAANLSGTPALPNGTTATTQAPGTNDTKLATTAFVIANAGAAATWPTITSKPEYYVDGSAGYETFAAAVATLNAAGTNCTLVIPAGTHAVTTDLAVNANITLRPLPSALITITSTKYLSILGRIEAGEYQIFSDGNAAPSITYGVRFTTTSLKPATQAFVRPEWWGWDYTTADEAPCTVNKLNLQRAIYSVSYSSTVGNGVVQFGSHQYIIWGGVTLTAGVTLSGIPVEHPDEGTGSSLWNYGNFDHTIKRYGGNGGGVRHLNIRNLPTNPTTWAADTVVAVGKAVYPSNTWLTANPTLQRVFVCTGVAGDAKSGVAEPTWDTAIGASTTDDQVTWETRHAFAAGIYVGTGTKYYFNIVKNNFSSFTRGIDACGIYAEVMGQSHIEDNWFVSSTNGVRGSGSAFQDCWIRGNTICAARPGSSDNPGSAGGYSNPNDGIRDNSRAYNIGDVVLESGTLTRPAKAFICEVAGTTHTSAPSWPTVIGQSVAEGSGTVVWRCINAPAGWAAPVGGRSLFQSNIFFGGHYGAYFSNATNMKFVGNDFNDFTGDNLYITAGSHSSIVGNTFGTTVNNGCGIYVSNAGALTVTGNAFMNAANYGFYGYATIGYLIVTNNSFYNNTVGNIYSQYSPTDVRASSTSDTGLIEKNSGVDIGATPLLGSGAFPWVDASGTYRVVTAAEIVCPQSRTEGKTLRLYIENATAVLNKFGQDTTAASSVRTYENAAWGAELRDTAAFDYFDDTPAVDDAWYWVSKTGAFSGIKYQVGTDFAATSFTMVWEYLNTSNVWTTLVTDTDPNTALVGAGVKTVLFIPPSDWACKGEGYDTYGLYQAGWGIRLRISAVDTPTQGGANATTKPQFCFMRLDSDTITGSTTTPTIVNLVVKNRAWWQE